MKIEEFILNGNCSFEDLQKLDLSSYSDDDKKLFAVCMKLKAQQLPVNAESIYKTGGKDMLVKYIALTNQIDKQKLKV